jgi:hypothetical protein
MISDFYQGVKNGAVRIPERFARGVYFVRESALRTLPFFLFCLQISSNWFKMDPPGPEAPQQTNCYKIRGLKNILSVKNLLTTPAISTPAQPGSLWGTRRLKARLKGPHKG